MSIEDLVNSRLRAIAVVILVWAVIYLPALGSIAIKGEEGRRILPAVRMLETGNYIVPQVGSNPYYRKPPLVKPIRLSFGKAIKLLIYRLPFKR